MLLMVAFLAGCASRPQAVPPEWQAHIDPSVSFAQLLSTADSYRGRTVLLGGEILSAKRVEQGTQFEILQLPVGDNDVPAERRTESQGRFLALNREASDPAALAPGTRVTLVGEVTGDSVQRLDASDYRYPTVEVKHLHVWDEDSYQRRRGSPMVGFFGGLGFGMGGGRSGSFGGLGVGTGF
jgi:outer membrane lipoprotein